MRLNRLLAAAGFGSRRACDQIILDGRVTIDGKVSRELGVQVDVDQQDIRCDRERVRPKRPVVYAFHKPRGVICTDAPGKARRVVEYFPKHERLFTVGRLDADSSGLILVTNDGILANRIAHPRYEVPKTYRVRVRGVVPPEKLAKLRKGVYLADGRTSEAGARIVRRERDQTVLLITLREGRNREVRRMVSRIGFDVQRLTRVAIGALPIGKLKPGESRKLSPKEQEQLLSDEPPKPGKMKPPGKPRRHQTATGHEPYRGPKPKKKKPATKQKTAKKKTAKKKTAKKRPPRKR
jgi:23S rRNA pseudouridine2605 synthase